MAVTTLKDIAKHTGLSVPTVSLILNGRGQRYRASSQEAVVRAAHALKYRPDAIVGRVTSGQTRRDAVGFLIRSESASHLANQPAYEFVCGVSDLLQEHDQFMVMVRTSDFDDASHDCKLPRLLRERFIDGLIVETGLPPHMAEVVTHYEIPAVWLNTGRREAYDCVSLDEVHAGRLACQHVLSLGHNRVMFLRSSRSSRGKDALGRELEPHFSSEARCRGYREAMAEAGRAVEEVEMIDSDGQAHGRAVRQIVASLRSATPVTALVASSFAHGIRVIQLLTEAGFRCPRDISIICAEDVHMMRRIWPHITGISCDRYQMGQWAAQMMLDKVEQQQKPQPSKTYRGSIIQGTTVAPAAPREKTRGGDPS